MGNGQGKLRILLVEDNPAHVRYLQEALASLEASPAITCVERLAQALEYLGRETPDVVLLDLGLPDSRGLATLEQVAVAAAHRPIIVLTALDDESLGVQAVRMGAQDYLVKGEISPRQLVQTIQHAIERKRLESALRLAQEELELRVQQRTAELARANAELTRSKEQAESASRAKGVFLANMSHEMRTPLNAILGMTELVLRSPLSAQQQEYLTIVRDAGESLLTRIAEILDIAQIEAEETVLARETFPLQEGLQDLVAGFASLAQQRGLALACAVAPDVPLVVIGDHQRLRQVLAILLGNAIKFTERGQVLLEAKLESLADRQAVLQFTVSDTGIGIPDDKRSAIFELFEQADGSMARRHGGVGLGLTIACRLVAWMGGRLWVDSELGRGSRFHFTVQFGMADSELTPPAAARPRDGSRKLRVLLADDTLLNRKLALALLERQGHSVTVAADAEQVLAALETGHVDLILIGLPMAERDGLEALQRRAPREPGTGAHIPAIAITAQASQGDRERCLAAGMDGYVVMPIDADELFAAIDAVLAPQA